MLYIKHVRISKSTGFEDEVVKGVAVNKIINRYIYCLSVYVCAGRVTNIYSTYES